MATTSGANSMDVGFKGESGVELMNKLLFNENFADTTFIVENQRLPVHSNILAASSEYFRAMFLGNFKESEKMETHIDEKLEDFKLLIQYVYKGLPDLDMYNINKLMDIIIIADKYLYFGLVNLIEEHVMKRLNTKNMGEILDCVKMYKNEEMYNLLLKFIDSAPLKIIRSHGFQLLSKEVVTDIIKRDSFGVDELDIFKAIVRWSKTHTKDDLKFVLPSVRFTLIEKTKLQGYVASTGVLTKTKIESIVKEINNLQKFPYRDGWMQRSQEIKQKTPSRSL